MPKNSLYARARSLIPAWLPLLVGVGVAMSGCARFPSGGGIGDFTRISFRIRVQGRINDTLDDNPLTQYVYIIALRILTTDDIPNTGSPQPVLGDNTPNGFVAGSPTHFVRYDSTLPNQPYTLYKFNPGPTPGDPSNPINLASWFDTTPTRGRIINFTRPTDPGADPRELRFDLYANQLVDADIDADSIRRVEVNILTMTRLANTAGATRVWDALGNSLLPSTINGFVTADLRANSSVGNTGGLEPSGDTVAGADPDLDITDFSIEVQRP